MLDSMCLHFRVHVFLFKCQHVDNEATLCLENRPVERFEALLFVRQLVSILKGFTCPAKWQTGLSNGQVVLRLVTVTLSYLGSARFDPAVSSAGEDGQSFLSWVQTAAGGGR